MSKEAVARVEREVLRWNGVSKDESSGGPGRGGFRVPPFTSYRFGRREIGHIHHDAGVADLTFPKKVRDELVSAGRAQPHGAGLAGVVSYQIKDEDDVPKALELFRMNYERLKGTGERKPEKA